MAAGTGRKVVKAAAAGAGGGAAAAAAVGSARRGALERVMMDPVQLREFRSVNPAAAAMSCSIWQGDHSYGLCEKRSFKEMPISALEDFVQPLNDFKKTYETKDCWLVFSVPGKVFYMNLERYNERDAAATMPCYEFHIGEVRLRHEALQKTNEIAKKCQEFILSEGHRGNSIAKIEVVLNQLVGSPLSIVADGSGMAVAASETHTGVSHFNKLR